jgi:membrane-bound metal-dependent hydrolase YbcI (DUF457 family)
MGPGLFIKALLQGSFSLLIFGWTQIVIDLQPLFQNITGRGEHHGFTHTYAGACVIGVIAATTGKYMSEWLLVRVPRTRDAAVRISWPIAFASAFIGSFSHVLLDSIMHANVRPLAPFSQSNMLLHLITTPAIYRLCVYSGLAGAGLYFAIRYVCARRKPGMR